jgi:hypothetical protein
MFVTSGVDYQQTSGVCDLQHINFCSTTDQSCNDRTTDHTSRRSVDTMPAS